MLLKAAAESREALTGKYLIDGRDRSAHDKVASGGTRTTMSELQGCYPPCVPVLAWETVGLAGAGREGPSVRAGSWCVHLGKLVLGRGPRARPLGGGHTPSA